LRPRLNLAQAKSQRDRPAHAVPPIHGRLQQQLYLIDRERLDLVVNQLSRGAFANDRRIPTQIAAPYRIVHCRPNRLVGFMGRGR
jgi:hypothetical protein